MKRGQRVYLTATKRILLPNFFKVLPAYLVSDPPDYSNDLLTDMENDTDRFETWLIASTAEWQSEPEIYSFFQHLSSVENPRRYLAVFEQLLHEPVEKLERLVHSYNPSKENGNR